MGILVNDILTVDNSKTTPIPIQVPTRRSTQFTLPEPIDITATMWLSVPTFGIYGIVIFFRLMKTYINYSPTIETEKKENLELWFWLYIAFAGVGALLLPIGILFIIASLVFGRILLNKVIKKRDLAFANLGSDCDVIQSKLKDSNWHLQMWFAGNILSFLILPFVAVILQAIQLFREYNYFVSLLRERS